MSTDLIETRLEGYDTQVDSHSIRSLNLLFDNYGLLGTHMKRIANSLVGSVDRPITEDGYNWFFGLHFERKNGKIEVLFPWTKDFDRNSDTTLDRSIAVYTSGTVDVQDVDQLIGTIYERLAENYGKKKSEKFA